MFHFSFYSKRLLRPAMDYNKKTCNSRDVILNCSILADLAAITNDLSPNISVDLFPFVMLHRSCRKS